MDEESNFLLLLTEDPETNKFLAIMMGVMFFSITYHASVFFHFKSEEIQLKDTTPEWNVSFDQETQISQETQIIADAQKASFYLDIEPSSVGEGKYVGFLEVSVTYQETSDAFLDPCDFVSVNLRPEGIIAQWNDENNTLSGSSDNCQSINLFLQIYPDYDGSNTTQFGQSKEEVESTWSNDSFGFGELNLEVEVNTQERVSGVPTQSDDDEEITVSWTLHAFKPLATRL